ncbi:hypothetical protein NDU88_000958 [Pleurodeles waltl]|uniref:Uncharacterized protein n=1 Tax=Pleurodeles waltl TaxID=8319 RepID=A0AAV7WH05_PLEWA|nr:hypothetical protein NDU88_000958 [Pleurodeles waltl]
MATAKCLGMPLSCNPCLSTSKPIAEASREVEEELTVEQPDNREPRTPRPKRDYQNHPPLLPLQPSQKPGNEGDRRESIQQPGRPRDRQCIHPLRPWLRTPRAEQRNLSSEPGSKEVEVGYTKPLAHHEKCLLRKRNLLQRGKTPAEGVRHPIAHPMHMYSNHGLKAELAPAKKTSAPPD